MTLYQYKDGFRYTSDTMFLYDFALKMGIKKTVLDIGAGCGILGLLLAKKTGASVTLLEKNPKMAELCIKNSEVNSVQCSVVCEDFLTFNIQNRYDYIVSNPPYYKNSVQKSQNQDLQLARYEDSLSLDTFLIKSYAMLKSKGSFIFCYDSSRLIDISFIVASLKPKAAIVNVQFLHSKFSKPSKLAFFHIKKESNAYTQILEPFIVCDEQKYSQKVIDIFSDADCKSIDV
jgi:tRNA1(Val) A37 N6-methylase TrmN6